jgi:hypothetical protein
MIAGGSEFVAAAVQQHLRHAKPNNVASLTGFASLWRIRHFYATEMRIPPL